MGVHCPAFIPLILSFFHSFVHPSLHSLVAMILNPVLESAEFIHNVNYPHPCEVIT